MRYVIELNFTNASFLSADDGDSSSIEEDTIEPPVIAQASSEGEDAVCARGWNRLMGQTPP